ncbi:MAG TPA: HAMP domain-containing sensor histidine kinase [Longimicrobium sp.]|nr:HAMP domain-containing sensor histidine kinase [Longimicrobium sp.]
MSPTEPTPDPPPRPGPRRWAGRAAFAFVLLTLVTLVVVPVLVQWSVTALRAQIEASEPARTEVNQLRYNLVAELWSVNRLYLTGAEEHSGDYAEARAGEREALARLAAHAEVLGPEVEAQLAEVRRLAGAWHARIGEEEVLRARADGARDPLRLGMGDTIFDALDDALDRLDRVILETTADKRDEIEGIEGLGLHFTSGLGVLALGAAGVVLMFELRVRRLAEEAERRRAEAERKRLEAEAAVAATARANEARAKLIRGITHDVKNPLGAAKGYAQLLAMGVRAPMLPEQAPLVAGIERSVDGALAIIADLLDVARADSGGLAVHPAPVRLEAVVRAAVDDHRAAAEAAGHTLVYEPPPEPLEVRTDPARVAQVLGNLLSNAVKYTPAPGRITVRARASDDGGASWAVVRVADTGPGIPPEQREAVFDEFSRLDEGAAVQGHGLGLAIARRIARLLGGDLGLEETEGPGAVFVLRLPCAAEGGGAGG